MNTPTLPKGVTLHRGSLRIAFRPPGHRNQVKRSLGVPPTAKNIEAAEQMLTAIKWDIKRNMFDLGRYFPNDPLLQDKPYTIAELFQTFFLDRAAGKKQNTIDNYTSEYNVVVSAVGKMNARDMDVTDALEVQKKLLKVTTVAQTNTMIGRLRNAFRRAVVAKQVRNNPFNDIEHVPVSHEDTDDALYDELNVYTIGEAEQLVAKIRSEEKQRLFTFLFWTGMRHGEAAALKREDVALPYIIIRRNFSQNGALSTPKTKSGRRKILLPQRAIDVLEEQLLTHDNDCVFTHKYGEPFKNSQIINHNTWKNVCERAKLRHLVPYTTRHSFISWMLAAGESPFNIAEHVGHLNAEMIIKRYGHFIPKKQAKWTLDDPAKFKDLKSSMKTGG